MKTDRRDDAHDSWSIEKGVGYCLVRSSNHRRRLGHLFVCKQSASEQIYPDDGQRGRPDPGVTIRCCWCWCVQK